MQIINNTKWSTRNIKTIAARVCDEEQVEADYRKRLTIVLKYGKNKWNGQVGGWAYYSASTINVFVGKDKIIKSALALVIAHEIQHNLGKKHRALNNCPRYDWVPGWKDVWGWAEDYTLEKQKEHAPLVKSDEQKAQEKMEAAHVLLKKWESKKKAAANKVTKYKDKVRYYEQRKAALGKPKNG